MEWTSGRSFLYHRSENYKLDFLIQAETNDYEYSSTDDESPATTSVKKPSLSRPTEFVALVPDPRRRRDIIDNAELKEVKAAFQQAASCWVPVANRYIKLQKDLPAMQCNASLDENDLVDAACLAQGAGFPVRVPWRKNLKIRDIKDSGITDHELRDELMDVFEARQMFIERNEKLKIDIKARKAENVRVAELEATQRAIRISLGISKPDFTHRDGTR